MFTDTGETVTVWWSDTLLPRGLDETIAAELAEDAPSEGESSGEETALADSSTVRPDTNTDVPSVLSGLIPPKVGSRASDWSWEPSFVLDLRDLGPLDAIPTARLPEARQSGADVAAESASQSAWQLAVGGALPARIQTWGAPTTSQPSATVVTSIDPGEQPLEAPQDEPLFGDQWHLAMLGDIEAVWEEYDGSGIHVLVVDDGVEHTHQDLNDNYDISSHILWNGAPLDPAPTTDEEAKHGTAVAGVIAAEDNGLGTVGIAYAATLTGLNILSGTANINDENDTSAFEHAIRQIHQFDITNNSWGSFPVYLTDTFAVIMAAFDGFKIATETGRGGLGTINLKAAGNAADSSQGDALDPTRYTVTVSAYDSDGDASWYTSRGANVLVAAPSSGHTIKDDDGNLLPDSDLRIATVDRTGAAGYGDGDWSSSTDQSGFGGTSSATPTVAGIVALMLEANPNLGWRDVQDILAYSARHIGGDIGVQNTATEIVPRDADFDGEFETTAPQLIEFDVWKYNDADDWNGGGLHQSNDYGMGAVHAHDAVRMAEVWSLFTDGPSTSANEVTETGGRYENERTVFDQIFGRPQHPDAIIDTTLENSWFGREGDPVSFSYDMTVSGLDMTLDYVDLYLQLNTISLADLEITLTSPGDTQITLMAEDYNDYAPEFTSRIYLDWTWGAHAFKGEDPNGVWTVEFTEFRLGNVVEGTDILGFPTSVVADGNRLTGVELTFHGDAGIASSTAGDDTWTYTDEAFASLANEPGRLALTDIGGTDWFNAAAMTGNIVLDLAELGGASIDGQAFAQFSAGTAIENAVTGDGDDYLSGDGMANVLMGMRGDDTIEGGAGADTLDGGAGIDTATYQGSAEGVIARLDGTAGVGGDAAGDVISNVENLVGSAFADQLIGDGSDNLLFGGAGIDALDGGAGADVLNGGAGLDWAVYVDAAGPMVFDLVTQSNSSAAFAEDTLISIELIIGSSAFSNTFVGDEIANVFAGGSAIDSIAGNGGADLLQGLGGNDIIMGGSGSDGLMGGKGSDTMSGGADADGFYFQDGDGADIVEDFVVGEDALVFISNTYNSVADLIFGSNASGDATVSYGSSTITLIGVEQSEIEISATSFFWY